MTSPETTAATDAVLCELCTISGQQHDSLNSNQTVPADDIVQCANDAIGKYQVTPDSGAPIMVWLCADHRHAYDDYLTK